MKPLRDLILIKRQETYKEEKTDGGLFLIKGDAANYNFKSEEESTADILQKKTPTKGEFIGKLVEFNRKKHGRYYNFHPGETGNDLTLIEKNERLKDIIFGKKDNSGVIEAIGNKCLYFKNGDNVIYRKYSEIKEGGKDEYILVQEKDILVKKEGDNYFVHPDYVIVKISKESRDNVFKKKLKNDKGEEVVLFLPTPNDKSDANHSEFFVTCGEIYGVGSNVKGVEIGDIAICNYLVDNDNEIIVGYEGEDKLIVITAITKRHDTDLVIYANRRSNRNQIVYQKGDYDEICQLLGTIRDNELYPRDPYIFLSHESTVVNKKTPSGITFTVDEKIIKRKILAISEESRERNNLKKGDMVVMDDFDLFDISLDGYKISAINDVDVMAPAW